MKDKHPTQLRIPELDSLRGIAAFAVMYFHYTFFFRTELQYNFSSQLDFEWGHYGVELFFMISGFVILMSLEQINSAKEFLYKRFVRLYPTYWIAVSLTLCFLYFSNFTFFNFTTSEKFFNFLMFQGLFHIRNIDGSYWTLIPELCFYIMMIVLWKFKLLKQIMYVSLLWLLLMFLSLLRPSIIDILLNLKFGMFFLIGMMFYKLKENRNLIYPHLIIVLSLVSVWIVRNDLYAFISSSFFVLIFYLLIHGRLQVLNNRFLIVLGKISYPLYLLHHTIGFILIATIIKLDFNHYLAVWITIVSMVGLAWLVYEFLEKPLQKRLK